LDPAAEIVVASLFQAVDMGRIEKNDLVLLNITGGGYNMLGREKYLQHFEPDVVVTPKELTQDRVLGRLQNTLCRSMD
jgi:cysteate synthase